MEEKRKVKEQDHRDFRGSIQKSSHLCGTEFWKKLSHACRRQRMNHLMCRGIHGDCSLYFTEGILKIRCVIITSISMPSVCEIRTYGSIMTSTDRKRNICHAHRTAEKSTCDPKRKPGSPIRQRNYRSVQAMEYRQSREADLFKRVSEVTIQILQ